VFAVAFKICVVYCDDVYSDRKLWLFGITHYLHLEDEVTGFFHNIGTLVPELVV
jgi:hypothetical protein